MYVVSNQRHIQCKRQPFAGDKKEDVEKGMKNIFWEHQRIEAVALINRVLVVRL
jgi:hypothetical protein